MSPKRFAKLLEHLSEAGVTLPATRREVMRYRGVGPEAIKEMENRGLIAPDPIYDHLSVRAATQLQRLGITTREQACSMLGRDASVLKQKANWGPILIRQVRRWIAQDLPRS